MDNLNHDMTLKQLAAYIDKAYIKAVNRLTDEDEMNLAMMFSESTLQDVLAVHKKHRPKAIGCIILPDNYSDNMLVQLACLQLLTQLRNGVQAFQSEPLFSPPHCHLYSDRLIGELLFSLWAFSNLEHPDQWLWPFPNNPPFDCSDPDL